MVVGKVSSGASLEVGWRAGGVARLVCYTGCGTKLDLASWRGSMDEEVRVAQWARLWRKRWEIYKSAWIDGLYVVSCSMF